MLIFLPLLVFIGPTSAKKQGDFGFFSACITKNSLRLKCEYAHCLDSPPFECEFFTSAGSPIPKDSNKCEITIPNHRLLYGNTTTGYNCTLTRQRRAEHKHITVDYSKRLGKKRIRNCTNASFLLPRPAAGLLWPAVVLSLWGVLAADGQPT